MQLFDRQDCPWCGGSGHVGDCDEANWLAATAANNGWYGERVSPEWMREAARKAVEKETCPKN